GAGVVVEIDRVAIAIGELEGDIRRRLAGAVVALVRVLAVAAQLSDRALRLGVEDEGARLGEAEARIAADRSPLQRLDRVCVLRIAGNVERDRSTDAGDQ